MFSTESSVILIKPSTALHYLTVAEEASWSAGIFQEDEDGQKDMTEDSVSERILRHGNSVKKIHSYFGNLEYRKCGLLLAPCQRTFSNVRLVHSDGRDSGIEEGPMTRNLKEVQTPVAKLSSIEFPVFHSAYLCATFPVLGAPDPPSSLSPSPLPPMLQEHRFSRLAYSGILSSSRPSTPYSFHDSGLEEQDDTALIPAETLCELLRRAFRLSPEKFSQYEKLICDKYGKKSFQKILAEELVGQLYALENNSNPFYSPHTITTRDGYDKWQQRERTHISDLIDKFWHFSLPSPSMARPVETQHMVKNYKNLLAKLISYESPYRQHNDDTGPPPISPLSSAALRLLKEFGLRYGVGNTFRKIAYLEYLVEHFETTIWFVQHITSAVFSIMELFPSNRCHLIIVGQELSMLTTSLDLLEGQVSNSIIKMKSLFPNNRPPDGIVSLIELLSACLKLKGYLTNNKSIQLDTTLRQLTQKIYPAAYSTYKMVAINELQNTRWANQMSPKLVNMLITFIREEIRDYENNYQGVFERYFNISQVAARTFYSLLSEDVSQLCQLTRQSLNCSEIDLMMLSLTFRMNQLDQDWSSFIPPLLQKWRDSFLLLSFHWSVVLKLHLQTLVLETIAGDQFKTIQLQMNSTMYGAGSRRSRSTSIKSLTPSVNSAFSSVAATPRSSSPLPEVANGSNLNSRNQRHPSVIHETSGEYQVSPREETKTTSKSTVPRRPRMGQFSRNMTKNVSKELLKSSQKTGSYHLIQDGRSHDDTAIVSFSQTNTLKKSKSLPNLIDTSNLDMTKEPTWLKHQSVGGFSSSPLTDNEDKVNDYQTVTDELTGGNSCASSPFLAKIVEFPVLSATSLNVVSSQSTIEKDDEPLTPTTPAGPESYPKLKEVRKDSSSVLSSAFSKSLSQSMNEENKVNDVSRPPDLIVHNPSLLSSETSRERYKQARCSPDIKKFFAPLNVTDTSTNTSHDVPSSLNTEEISTDFINSFQSDFTNISLPRSNVSGGTATTLPLSNSVCDMMVILQRVLGFGKSMFETLTPVERDLGQTTSMNSLDTASTNDGPLLAPSNRSCSLLYSKVLKVMCNSLCIYADNMLCLDLCGTTLNVAIRLAGPKMIEHLKTQQSSGLVWGCRHGYSGSGDCFKYINKKSDFLCDRYEPVQEEMCTRINNLSAVLDYLSTYQKKLAEVFKLEDISETEDHFDDLDSVSDEGAPLSDEYEFLESYKYEADLESKSVILDTNSSVHNQPNNMADIPEDPTQSVSFHQCQRHLLAVIRALSRILAYRLNLFTHDALTLLLSLKMPMVSMAACLKPVTDFLRNYIEALSSWLYHDCFRRVLECIWYFLVQDFESELAKLQTSNSNSEQQAAQLMEALTHMIRFMNNNGKGIKSQQLLSQADDVTFRLQLNTMSTPCLIALSEQLQVYYSESQILMSSEDDVPQLASLHRMKADLQAIRKCFSGKDLVRWIYRNHDILSEADFKELPQGNQPSRHDTKERAQLLAQKLLDRGIVREIYNGHGRSHASSISSSADSRFQFPEVSIYKQVSEALTRIDSGSDLNSESDLDETPRASPQPETTNADSGLAEYSFSEEFSQTREAQDEAVTFDTAMTSPLLDNEKFMRIGKYIEDQREFSGEHRKLAGKESEKKRQSDGINVNTFIERDSGIENKSDVNSTIIDIHRTDDENASLTKNLCKNETEHYTKDESFHLAATSTPITSRNDETHENKRDDGKFRPLTFNKKTSASNPSTREHPHHHVQYINKNVQNLIHSSGVGGDITPQSDSSGPKSVSSSVFTDSPIRFYSFAPSSTDDDGHRMSRNNGNFQFTYRHRHRKELCGLVESCFEKKIMAEGVKAIIYSRRKTDRVAKKFGMT